MMHKEEKECTHRNSFGETTIVYYDSVLYDKCLKCGKYFDWGETPHEVDYSYGRVELIWGRDYQGNINL